MKVNLLYDEEGITERVRREYLDPLCKKFYHANGLDGVNIMVTAGLAIIEGYDAQGKKDEMTIGFSTIRDYKDAKIDTLVSFIIQSIRKKLGYPAVIGSNRRQHLGKIMIPNEWFKP